MMRTPRIWAKSRLQSRNFRSRFHRYARLATVRSRSRVTYASHSSRRGKRRPHGDRPIVYTEFGRTRDEIAQHVIAVLDAGREAVFGSEPVLDRGDQASGMQPALREQFVVFTRHR
jgi:hypothetical protein